VNKILRINFSSIFSMTPTTPIGLAIITY
jgi:hypothetical protein